jgi:ABC-type polysaccharide/polyol phosphate export permease
LIVFFKDLGQIVGIILQFGVWLTPIMWNINIIPRKLDFIFKANPMYYIVTGYRNCLIYRTFEIQDIKLCVYFWLVTLITFAVGSTLLSRLKPHFSDIL